MARLFNGVVERADYVLGRVELAMLVHPALQVLTERAAGDGYVVPVDKVVFHQEVQNF